MKVVTVEEMRRIERAADESGHSYATMMENAGRAVAEACQQMRLDEGRVLILVGPGNNGGDGLVAGRYLREAGSRVTCYVWKRRVEEEKNFRLVEERGIPVIWAEEDEGLTALRKLAAEAEVIVDALLGTGASRPLEGLLKEILTVVSDEVNRRRSERKPEPLFTLSSPTFAPPPHHPFVVAVDVPSGLDCDSGAVDPATLPADLTVTFGFPKRGQFRFPGAEAVGRLMVADIGIPPALADDVSLEVITPATVRSLLPARPLGAHKGTFGRALIVAGSANYTGAAALAGAAATRVGTGLVTLAVASSLHPILAAKVSETTFLLLPHDMGSLVPDALKVMAEHLPDCQALLVGPGAGRERETVAFVHELLGVEPGSKRERIGFRPAGEGKKEEEETTPQITLPPMVIDADGLNALADAPRWWKRLPSGNVLTPHPGEMARLVGRTVADVEDERVNIAQEAAARWKQVVVLKGAYTVVAEPEGRTVINPFANPGLATAGSGDVLAGAIVGFLAQGLTPFAAAVVGVYLHGLAGELVRRELGVAGMIAGDLLPKLPQAAELISHKPVFC
ncbi:MAG: NAD(P)H-hydrate dehydratase [Chloroflexota bacterium]|nr:NAD(P)H-hydrate dehydratase [Chloroflexota bacterium]